MMRQYIPDYHKAVDFSRVVTGVEAAVVGARRLDEEAQAMNETGRNPTTGMHLLVDSLRRDGQP